MFAYLITVFSMTGSFVTYCNRASLDDVLGNICATDPYGLTFQVKPVRYSEFIWWCRQQPARQHA